MSADDLSRRAGDLSPEKLALLVMRMKKKRAAEASEETPGTAGRKIPRRAPSALPAPASFSQQRLWLLDRIEPGGTAFNMPMAARLRGVLDRPALEAALAEIVRRHESLRTTFAEVEGAPVQVIAPSGSWHLPVVDLSALPGEARPARDAERSRLILHDKQPFDLARGPLFRAGLLQLGAEEHALLLNMHHIVSDGWSFGILFRELGVLYGAFRERRPPRQSPLPELPIQYADFAVWQREWLQGPVLDAQIAWWRERLAGCPPALELPTDRPRPAVQSHRGGRVLRDLPAGLVARLRDLSRQEGVSMFMTLLAGFQLLLARLSGQDDVVAGSPSAGRGRTEIEGLIGLFLNTLVLRTDLSGDPTFRELLVRVRDGVLGAYRYQDLPFERLLEDLKPERQLSRTPIFQVLFNYVSLADLTLELAGLTVEPLRLDDSDAKFDFTLYVRELPDTLVLDLVYSADLFEPARMEELLRQLEHLMDQAAAAPESHTGALSLVTAASAAVLPDPARPLSGEWRGAGHQAVSRYAGTRPGRTAVRDARGESWTWAELEARTNRLARFLIDGGVEKGDAVAVWAYRSAHLVEALLGTLEAGAAFLILDPAYPVPRLLDYLRIGRPTGWIGVAGAPPLPAELEQAAGLCRCRVELPSTWLEGLAATDPGVPVGPDDAACITFTSGSTGVPKGVVGRHGSLTHFYPWMGERFGLGGDDRHGMLSALSHDPLQRDLLTPLWFGAELVVPDPEGLQTPGYLADWARRERMTVLNLTPAMMELLLDAAASSEIRELPDLRRAFVVGDQLKKTDVERLHRLAPSLLCVNLYGSTETQRAISFFEVPRGLDVLAKEVLPLGRGFEGCQLLVLNRAGRLAGVGELGEIHVRSRQLARGYLGDDALTAERFLPNPFVPVPEPGDRAYRTGDLGRYLPDGGVEFAGRADFQVKLRGFRIELGEVEAALSRFPGARECVAVIREADPGRKLLVAYLVVTGEAPEPGELRAFLAGRLPDYMVPSAFVVLPALPLTQTGKVDRRALPPPEPADREGAAPRDAVETALAEVWAEVLRREGVGIHDNFFEIGGDSIRTIQVVARGRKRGLILTPRQIFQHQTIAELARVVEVERIAEGPLPWTPAQRRLLSMGSMPREAVRVDLPPGMGIEALEKALAALTARYDALRLRFEAREQRVTAAPVLLDRLPAGTDPAAALRGLNGGPEALRAAVIPSEPAVLLLAAHPLAVDGPSWRVLLADLVAPPPEPAVPFSRWAEAMASEPAGAEAPSVRPQAAVTVHLAESETSALLREALAAYGSSVEEILLVAVAEALGSPRVSVAVEDLRPERDGLDGSATAGCLAAPVRVDLESRSDPATALKEGKERLHRALRQVGQAGGDPDAAFRWWAPLAMPAPWRAERMALSSAGAGRLRVDCGLEGGRLRSDWASGDAFPREDLERIAGRFAEILGTLIRHCLSPEAGGFTPSDFPVSGLDQADLDRLLAELG
jgi:amino acid adenylation domain-containing protein